MKYFLLDSIVPCNFKAFKFYCSFEYFTNAECVRAVKYFPKGNNLLG